MEYRIYNEKASTLNAFFSSVFTKENMDSMPDQEERKIEQLLNEVNFTHEEVLKSLKTDKSPGPDQIHARLLKECAEELMVSLYTLFR